MRIAILTSEFPSLSETFVHHHVTDLVARGHEVEVFPERGEPRLTPSAEGEPDALLGRRILPPPVPEKRAARVAGVARHTWQHGWDAVPLLRSCDPRRFGRRGLSLSLFYRGLPLLDRRPYDLVHCHHGPTGVDAVKLQHLGLLNAPLVVSFHGHDLNVVPQQGGVHRYDALWHRAARLFVNSEFSRERLLALGAPEDRIRLLPVGVRVNDFRPAAPAAIRDERVLLSVGRLVPVKGFGVALHAFASLAARAPEWRYVIVGDGPQRAELEQRARQLGIAERVHFAGALAHDAVRGWMAKAQLYCQPSLRGDDGAEETQGLAVVEAQASGLPVVVSRSGGLPESVREGDTALLAAPGDARDLGRALRALAFYPERRARLGRAGRAFARHFDRDRITDALVGEYTELCQQTVRPPGRFVPPPKPPRAWR
ncbi:MAG: glycosyltransferase [Myxococcota bacterium]